MQLRGFPLHRGTPGPRPANFRVSRQRSGAQRRRFCQSQASARALDISTAGVLRVAALCSSLYVSPVEKLVLGPISKFEGTVSLPGSKSLSNRTLLLAALSKGSTIVQNVLDSDDTRVMVAALQQLGVEIEENWESAEMTVHGCEGEFPSHGGDLFLGNAGTAMRPLTAAIAAAGSGRFTLDGTPRMRERPIQDLVEGLMQLGVEIQCTAGTGCPPVSVQARGLRPGKVQLKGSASSQFLTALLMAAPLTKGGDIEIEIVDELVSAPYVAMTVRLMQNFGIDVHLMDGLDHIIIPGDQDYVSPGEAFIEGDASSATYFLAGAAIAGGEVTVHGCGRSSLQGDIRFVSVLEKMGANITLDRHSITVNGYRSSPLVAVDEDCNDIPDAAMTLAVVALFAQGTTTIRNVYNWRLKETERMKAIVTELRKLGATVEEGHDFCRITPPAQFRSASIETYDDHRMAMAFSLAACSGQSVTILDPKCVRKTFPTYFDVLSDVTDGDITLE